MGAKQIGTRPSVYGERTMTCAMTEQNLDKVDWTLLSKNPNAIHHILKQNLP
jgi:hypothetical protein